MRQYPRQCFVLTPTFNVKEVTITNVYRHHGTQSQYDQVQSGKLYYVSDLYATEKEAIEAGFQNLELKQASLKKQQDALLKKLSNLQTAYAKLNQGEPSV